MFAILGDIEFTLAGGITGMEQRGSADWAEHPRIQGKPLLEWIGEGLDEYSLTIELHSVLGDPEARLRALQAAKKKHEPLAFVMGSGQYLGPYVIVDLSNAIHRATDNGQIRSATVQVSLKEYTGAFTRKALRPGLLDPSVSGTSAAVVGSPGLISRMLPSPSTTQLVIGHAKTAGNVLKAGQNLYETVKSGNASMILGQVPQLLGVTARAIEPLQGLKETAGLLDDGSDLSRLGEDVLSSVVGARSSLSPVDLGNIVDRFAASRESLGQALTKMDGASTRLSGLAAQVLTRKA
ncbi:MULTISPECIES: phage tail protein [unclassified Pseudomonas]|uniref:phage tail protein n=1 Tax=unclassified Pseudomonas TaxID=196821 RepID=UPI00083833D7|nr:MULTISPECIES: phage tail protein [unclassified Pseudomonas]QIH08915.1 phage tail protein [Pseudomonas sp. BIOMIG1BAC]